MAIDNTVYIPIDKFGWDQQNKKVKVYLTHNMEGVGQIPKENVTCEFQDNSFDLRVQ